MTQPATTVLSVRGDAWREVPPDLAELHAGLRVFEATKGDALRVCSERLAAVLDALRGIGGAPMTAELRRPPLGWLAHSATTWAETEWRDKAQGSVPTGRVGSRASIRIEVRDLELVDALGRTLAQHDYLHVHSVTWAVEADNPAWPQVRAAAIEAAIQQGRDYAAALGGELLSIEHVADTGLLGGATELRSLGLSGRRTSAHSEDDGGMPSLDPVPQLLRAVIEARFTASVRPLT
jgi:hypothetical protein